MGEDTEPHLSANSFQVIVERMKGIVGIEVSLYDSWNDGSFDNFFI